MRCEAGGARRQGIGGVVPGRGGVVRGIKARKQKRRGTKAGCPQENRSRSNESSDSRRRVGRQQLAIRQDQLAELVQRPANCSRAHTGC